MNHIILLAVVSVSCALGAQLNSYLPPRGGAGSGAGLITGPRYTGAGGYNTGAYTGAGGYNTGAYSGAGGYNTGAYSGAGAGSGSYSGAPAGPVIPIISYENNPNAGDGTYSYSYQTGNGISAQESGSVQGPESGTSAKGSYSYTGPDGQQYTVTYTADANGFVAQGAHLPTPPPIPEAILQSLAFNAANPQSEFDTGSYSGSGSGSYTAPRPNYGAPAFPARPATSFSPSTGYHYRK